jgi:mono/diheme cytochrome c family protein
MISNQRQLLILFFIGALINPAILLAQANHCVAQKSPLKMSMEAGQTVYAGLCLSCHHADGAGSSNLNPSLIKTKGILGNKRDLIECVIKGNYQHTETEGQKFQNTMPPHPELTDDEIANVLTYVRKSFGNKASAVKASEVKTVRAEIKM